ncbi:substrate-binding domain-containing protein [candidate division WOR-3 bacterium]|nr:substrate-binding domain-containing protein [candidate division WOR-3 bacterium]
MKISIVSYLLFFLSLKVLPLNSIGLEDLPLQDGYFRLNASTSAEPLLRSILFTVLDIPFEWTGDPGDFRTILPLQGSVTDTSYLRLISNIYVSGTHNAYTDLIVDNVDLILVARSPSEDELEDAGFNGVEFEVHVVSYDAFVFLANSDNPCENLTLDQIRAIYSGNILQWTDLFDSFRGDSEIHPYQRERNSGSQELMEDLVMGDLDMIDAPDMIAYTMAGPFNALECDRQGIGYSVFFYAQNISPNERIKLLGIEGVFPTKETIRTEEYPLTTEVYAVIRKDTPDDHPARNLLNWILSEEGQKAVAESGYVPLNR